MEEEINFNNCLYFSTNSLSRILTNLADESFKPSGLSPSHAFTLMLVSSKDGICPHEIANKLNIKPSTVTRFIDVLQNKGLLIRKWEGKLSRIYISDTGKELTPKVIDCWDDLITKYKSILGEKYCNVLGELHRDALDSLG